MMTDPILPVDIALGVAAVVLLAIAVWLTRRQLAMEWDPAVFFGGLLAAGFEKGAFPLSGGPVPEEGWSGDPADLEAAYTPAERIEPGLTWDDVKTWSEAAESAVRRRADGVRVVWLESPPVEIPVFERTVVASVADIPALLPRPTDRLVLAASARATDALDALVADGALRDRLRAVLLVAPALDEARVAEVFTHQALDVEVAREVPWLTLRAGPDAARQVLPEPKPQPSGIRTVAAIDLGILPPELVGDPRVGRALAGLLAALA